MSKITGWSRINSTKSKSYSNIGDLQNLFNEKSSIIPRGSGMAYGDVAINENYIKIKSIHDRIKLCDENTLLVFSDVTIGEVLDFLHKHNKTLFVVPGSRFISIGGAIASDIHGKNHLKSGSFSKYVTSITMTMDGELVTETTKNEELFELTCGGMGLTGLIISAKMQVRSINCSKFQTKTMICANLTETFNLLLKNAQSNEFNIAWIDLMNNRSFGKSVIYASNLCNEKHEHYSKPPRLLRIPRLRMNLLQPRFMKLYNGLRFKNEKRKLNSIQHENSYKTLFPSDLFKNWNNLFGRKGLMEYQFCFSLKSINEAIAAIECIAKSVTPVLVAAKVFGESNRLPLSFPEPGIVFGITFPWKSKYLEQIKEWDDQILSFGAKKYFSKDQFSSKDTLHKMYPGLISLRDFRQRRGLTEKFVSSFSKRLEI